MRLSRVMVRAIRQEHLAHRRARRKHRAQRRPALARLVLGHRERRPELIAVRREMVQNRRAAVGRTPSDDVAARMVRAAVAAPEHDERHPEASGDCRKHGRMTERVGRIEHQRRGCSELAERRAPRQQISHERFAGGNQLVGEHVPRSRLERPVSQPRTELVATLGPHLEIVLEHDRLSVKQEWCDVFSIVEQCVNQGHEALPKSAHWVIPLAVPMRVAHDVDD